VRGTSTVSPEVIRTPSEVITSYITGFQSSNLLLGSIIPSCGSGQQGSLTVEYESQSGSSWPSGSTVARRARPCPEASSALCVKPSRGRSCVMGG
jgi:hypothetical protein